jgi:proteasome assembly chaperone (PAC2) family protein
MKLESIKNLQIIDKTGSMYIIKGIENGRRFFGLLSQKQERVVVINKEGVIRLHKNNGKVYRTTIKTFENDLNKALEQNIFYGDGGAEVSDCFIILPNRIVDLSGVIDKEQIISLAKVEISGLSDNDRILILLSKR